MTASASLLAFGATIAACAGLNDVVLGFGRRGWSEHAGDMRARLVGRASLVADVFVRAGNEGREAGVVERRRTLAAIGLAAFMVGWVLAGAGVGAIALVLSPAVASRALRARRERYRAAVDAAAGEMAMALADALAGGHSLRGAVEAAAGALEGPAGHELRRVAAELELGASTDEALDAMRRRVRGGGIDMVVAGALIQRTAGGDLVGLFRKAARSLEDERRLLGDVRAATAQARFTGLVVVLLPLGGGLLAELASPGFVVSLATSPLSAWLLGMALAMQAAAAFAIHRLARVRA